MKVGRNELCPCGSGKKYKKCCMEKDLIDETLSQHDVDNEQMLFPEAADSSTDQIDEFCDDFEAKNYEDKVACVIDAIDNLIFIDDMAFDMLDILYQESCKHNDRFRFNELLQMLKKKDPFTYKKDKAFYLSWSIINLLVEKKYDQIPEFTKELARMAGENIDEFFGIIDALSYHNQLAMVIDALPIARRKIHNNAEIVSSAIKEFNIIATTNIIFSFFEKDLAVDAHDPALLKKLNLYIELDVNMLEEYLIYITNKSNRKWATNDFPYTRISRASQYDYYQKKKKRKKSLFEENIAYFCAAFLGYLRHSENIPYGKAYLGSNEIMEYLIIRVSGDYEFNVGLHKKRFIESAFMLLPEEESLTIYLGIILSFFNCQYYRAAAMLEMLPYWLKFMKCNDLLTESEEAVCKKELQIIFKEAYKLFENYNQDPTIFDNIKKINPPSFVC
ncbi:MAG: hypothetical protein A2Y62_06365 [Candidatus Fischerbacteria bacterium RBG_13_37_8]|uniref:Uncharacterized protein n=1 Tax=Candidatus Fischerbacteria bacterium RBG_13_37_8 TaxID=1817863 RepID=A0A1F5VST2_9BACT|nr:MAG: hypothetical protein A2Y62_06365 [Candidatus Fischerbacteria bacterium RBG_13_37_8]